MFGPATWNSLPVHVRQSQCLVTLKTTTKDVFVHETPVTEWGGGGGGGGDKERERDGGGGGLGVWWGRAYNMNYI